ncbi:hypothetical protein Slin15195_G063880 [Septoria linicola]|uniref:Copper acquisition factor BIM1-like domain-containing protein n=1 Tax=Septoria linicola TaxID=215465 RepID=A0A9Q9EKA8_9PEZI|nr:hypothetical protein Slin14017_G114190 [Septoria linicola]USW53069.1 hypothetical protein Slin15195_G063880 [Septoria linicola]
MVRSLLVGLAAATLTSAHFTLNWPQSAGFDDENQPNGPCGGVDVTVGDDSQEITVDRFPVSIYSSHPAGSWSFFATTNTEAPYNFTEIVPVINSTGIGTFCLTYLRAPEEFAGQSGVLQVIDSSVDGTLYQCAPVRFVSGGNDTVSEFCVNSTQGFEAEWTEQSSTVSQTASNESSSSDDHSGHSESTSSTSSAGAAAATAVGSVLGLGLLAAGLAF